MAILGIGAAISFRQAVRSGYKVWILMAMGFFVWFLGDTYWTMFNLIYQNSPEFYVSETGWYASYLFLSTALLLVSTEEERSRRYLLPVILVVFATGMAVFYMTFGDYVSNIICAVLMSLLMYRSARGLLYLKEQGIPVTAPGKGRFYLSVLLFCAAEYCMWTATCFWGGYTILNPYYWFDILVSLSNALILYSLRGGWLDELH